MTSRGWLGVECGAGLASRSNTFERQQLVGATLNVLAGIAVLGLGALTDTFDLYGAPALMLVAVFAFLVLRLRFVLAYEELGTCAQVVPLGTPALKGKSDPVEVYQLVGLCSSEDGVPTGSADQTADANAS